MQNEHLTFWETKLPIHFDSSLVVTPNDGKFCEIYSEGHSISCSFHLDCHKPKFHMSKCITNHKIIVPKISIPIFFVTMRHLGSHCPGEQQQQRAWRRLSKRFKILLVSFRHVTGELKKQGVLQDDVIKHFACERASISPSWSSHADRVMRIFENSRLQLYNSRSRAHVWSTQRYLSVRILYHIKNCFRPCPCPRCNGEKLLHMRSIRRHMKRFPVVKYPVNPFPQILTNLPCENDQDHAVHMAPVTDAMDDVHSVLTLTPEPDFDVLLFGKFDMGTHQFISPWYVICHRWHGNSVSTALACLRDGEFNSWFFCVPFLTLSFDPIISKQTTAAHAIRPATDL